ncbi:MAG: hypothetical protein WBM24_25140 [Candidatus Sulfotelmatobacter sp.]
MRSRFFGRLLVLALLLCPWSQEAKAQNTPKNGGDFSDNLQPLTKVPAGVILVKGAWSSASDSRTPVPEGGTVANSTFSNPYFGMSYAVPPGWEEKYKGPPPSDSGRYVLLQLRPADTSKGTARGNVLVTAQDMFFTPLPAANALDLINYSKDHLQADYKVELPPTQTTISGHAFTFFAYWSPIAELHWYVLATEIRCHAVQIVLTSRDTKLLESLILDINKMQLPEEAGSTAGNGGGPFPVCIKDYANQENVITRVEPVFSEHKFNPVPVRIIIDKEGKVKHIHFLSAFPDQAKAITDAPKQWQFKRYMRAGRPVEVETGIMFGRVTYPTARRSSGSTTE